ncbi:MAG: YuiA family protein [Planifilum sp.]
MQALTRTDQRCLYCGGGGYYQLLLGGTETCPHCKGTGKQSEKEED